jgi:hypothetical protein
METSFTSRLVHAFHVIVAAIYLLGTIAALVLIPVGLGRALYGAGNYAVGYAVSGDEAPLVLPSDHRDALLRGESDAIEREARSRLEGGRATNYSLPWGEKLELERKIDSAIWDMTSTRVDQEKVSRSSTFDPLVNGLATAAIGFFGYFLVWTLRWLVTGRSSTVLGWLRRKRMAASR